MSTLAERYIQLAYGIQEHFPGYIDAYFGPAELKNVAKLSLVESLKAANTLREDAKDASPWLQAQVASMQTVLSKLSGQSVSYLEEVKQVYDIEPKHIDEAHFEKAHAALDALLDGKGNILERLEAFRERFTVSAENLHDVVVYINNEIRQRAKARFALPAEETFTIQLVKNQPWGAYNWYMGNYHSRIDLNTDLPIYLHNLPHLLTHEGYPGHHSERVLKEKHLYRDQQKLEHTIVLITSPEAVQAEGIAENALELAMTQREVEDLLVELLPVSKVKASKEDVRVILEVTNSYEILNYVDSNAAFLLHEQKLSEKVVLAYLERYSLNSSAKIQKTLEFLQAPTSASYVFTYTVGKELVAQVLKTGNPKEIFQQLLHNAYTPSMMREVAQP